MLIRIKELLLVLLCVFVFNSCSNYNKVLKGTDLEAKYVTALKYYNKKDYFRALPLFEELITLFRGTARGEEVYYCYAQCHYHTGDFISAAYHFENFLKTYPNSIYSEESAFLYAYCYYADTPISSLDQSNAIEALNKFQLFINRFPDSKLVDSSNVLMDELRMKQELKAYDNAMLYFKMEEYKAATTALGNVIKTFPGTRYKEICLYNMLKSSYFYARQSIEEKKLDRYKSAVENYFILIDAFPETEYRKAAEDIYKDCQIKIDRISKGVKVDNN